MLTMFCCCGPRGTMRKVRARLVRLYSRHPSFVGDNPTWQPMNECRECGKLWPSHGRADRAAVRYPDDVPARTKWT